MCNFFSFCGDGKGNYLYTGRAERNAGIENPDSHTAILTRAGIKPEYQDRWTKYEWIFDNSTETFVFEVDEQVEGHDHHAAQTWIESLDFVHAVGLSAFYKSDIEGFKSGIEVYKSAIENFESGIEVFESGIENYESDIERYKWAIERFTIKMNEWKAKEEA